MSKVSPGVWSFDLRANSYCIMGRAMVHLEIATDYEFSFTIPRISAYIVMEVHISKTISR